MRKELAQMLRRLGIGEGRGVPVQPSRPAAGLRLFGRPLPGSAAPVPAKPVSRAPTRDTGMSRHRTETRHGARDWLLHHAAEPAARPALVVMLHGCTQNAADFARGTGMNEAAGARGWHVAWPEQAPEANVLRCWNWFDPGHQAAGAGEPEILAAIVAEAASRLDLAAVDVFVAGLSAGGAMTAVLAETHPGLIRAIGVHSGVPTGAAMSAATAMAAMRGGGTAPARAGRVPMIVFHGSEDQTVSPLNGDALGHNIRGTIYHGRSSGRAWVARKGQAGEYWRVEGLAHAWSGGRPEGSHTDPAGPDATAEMLRFFAEQRP